MNDRIKELAEQANNDVSGNAFSMARYNEKFAELIVNECIKLCDQVDLVGADDCIDKIKDYFEVDQ
jgi:hypothetical protein